MTDPVGMDRVVMVRLGRRGEWMDGVDDERGRVLYLADRDLIVVVGESQAGRWKGEVVASLTPRHGRWVWVDPVDLAGGQETMRLAGGDPDRFTLVWLWRIWRHWDSGGRTAELARDLVHHARIPGTVRIALTPTWTRRVREAAHVTSYGLRRLITRLAAARFLSIDPPTDSSSCDTYTLTLPPIGVDVFGNQPADQP